MMRRDMDDSDMRREEADEILAQVMEERLAMRKNDADSDWERTLNYVKKDRSPVSWKLIMSIGALVVAVISIVSFFAREVR